MSHNTEESENSPDSPHLGEIKCMRKQCELRYFFSRQSLVLGSLSLFKVAILVVFFAVDTPSYAILAIGVGTGGARGGQGLPNILPSRLY